MKRQLFICLALLGLASLAVKAQEVTCILDGPPGPNHRYTIIYPTGGPDRYASGKATVETSPGPGNSTNVKVRIFGTGSQYATDIFTGSEAAEFANTYCPGLVPNVPLPTNSLPWLPMNVRARAGSVNRSSTAPARRTAAGSSRSFVFGQNSQNIASGDFNGDGSMDSAITNGAALTVTLYDSNDAVISSTNYDLPSNDLPSTSTSGIVAGDFNGDGKLDLAVELDPVYPATTGSIGILFGNGDGTFARAVSYPVSIVASSLATASLHGNGKLDLITSGTGTVNGVGGAYLAVLPGKGDGTFGTPTYLAVPQSISYSALIATDLTGDGKVDVALALDGEVVVYPGNGDGTFRAPVISTVGPFPSSLAYADVNEDGVLDLAIADSYDALIYVVFGNGDGSFGAPQTYVGSANIGSVSLVPIADGTAMIFPDQLDGAMVFAFAGDAGQFYLPQPQVSPGLYIAAADLNGDRISDVALAGSTGITVELNNGDGTFGAPAVYPTGSAPYSVAIAALIPNGKPDIVAPTPSGVSILMNTGAGLFQAGTPVPTGDSAAVAIDDFNGDGKPDLAITSSGASGNNTVSVVLGNGDGTFGPPLTFSLPATPYSIASGDFTGDGKTDLIVLYPSLNFSDANFTLALYPGKGDGTFGTPSILPVEGRTFAAGDLNGDGKPDLAIYQFSLTASNQVAILLGNGDGTFQPPIDIPVYNASSILITDVNGDGKPDLVLGDCCGSFGEASFLLGKGDGNFLGQNYFPSGPNPNMVAAGNFASPTQPGGLAITGYQELFGNDGGYVSPEFTVLQLGFQPSATITACDIVSIGATSVADAQGIINEALGASTPLDDLNDDGRVNVVDVQFVVNSVLGLGCAAS